MALRSGPSEHVGPLGFRVWRVRPRPMAMAHTHSDIEVNFLETGSLTYLHAGRRQTVRTGHFSVLWGGAPHGTLSVTDNCRGVWLVLPLTQILRWQLPPRLVSRLLAGEVVSSRPDPLDAPLLARWVEDFRSGGTARRAMLLEIEARFHRLALFTPRRLKERTHTAEGGIARIEKVTDYVARHYRRPLGVGEIARAAGLHEKYLMRLFRKSTRMSLWEYVTRTRLAHAQRLLLTTDLKVLDVALDAGFASLGPFYRAFAAYSPHLPKPLAYRRGASVGVS